MITKTIRCHNFDPLAVITALDNDKIDIQEAKRLLGCACHRLIKMKSLGDKIAGHIEAAAATWERI